MIFSIFRDWNDEPRKTHHQKVFFHQSRARAKSSSTLLRRTRQSCLAAAVAEETPTSRTIACCGHSIPHSPHGIHRRFHLPSKSHTMATQAAVMSAKATKVRTAPRARNPVTRFPASFYLSWLFPGTRPKSPSGRTRERLSREGTRARRVRRTGAPSGRPACIPRSRFPARASHTRRGAGSGVDFG